LETAVAASLPAFREVAAACRELRLGMDASELHGSLCGWLAGGGADASDWMRRVLLDETLELPADDHVFERLRRATSDQFEDRDFGFEVLIPDAGDSLFLRSGALFDWCRGFVGAFGLAAGAEPPLSEEGREALADLARLAAARAEEGGDEEDEAAFAEIEEFVRVAALLLHGDCALGPRHRRSLN
jgi:uncharacterized protein YgfB (UPF0149 family)